MAAAKRRCIDCGAEGVRTNRPAPYGGPRSPLCATHNRARRSQRRSTSWEKRIAATYCITADEYWEIYRSQGGKCAICQRATGAAKKLAVDHCHETLVVRGLLCTSCNKGVLGHLRDSEEALQRAIKYLKDPPAVRVIGVRLAPEAA